MQDCIFCKIASHEASAYVVYEDAEFIGFLDIFPVARGHVQLIPKAHYRWVWDVPNLERYFEIAGNIVSAQKRVFETDYVQALVAGSEIPHAHLWLIPVVEGAGGKVGRHGGYSFNPEEAPQLVEEIKRNF